MVGTMIATYYGLTGMAYAATAFAVNFAVSQIVTRVFGPDQQDPQDSGTREQVPPSNTNAIPIVYGDAYLGGTFVDAVISTDQKCMYYVMAISCISPNGQFTFDTTDMYYGDRKITFDTVDLANVASLTDEAGNVTDIKGNLYIGLYTSTSAGVITSHNWYAPSVVMGPTFAGFSIDPAFVWPSSGRQMNGLAFAIVRLQYNERAGTTSLQPITFKVKQALYGTGVAKPGDVWYDYITNKQYGGGVGWMPDGTFDPDFVDSSSASALNVYSDQLISYTPYTGGTSTQARYRINGVIDAGQTVLSNLDKIMSCCDSWMTYNATNGQWAVVINKAESASYSFNDNNIIGEIRVSATDITQSINQVEAKFPNKGARDQPDFVNLKTPDILLYPNEPVNKYSVSYDLVNDSVQAQYLANRVLEQAREDLIVSFNTTYYGIQVDAGSVVSVTNSDYGWSNKLFRVIKVSEASLPDGSLGARLELNEYNASVYDDQNITQFAPVQNSGLPSVYYFSALSAPTVIGYPSASYPNFDVTISIPSVGSIIWAELYYTTTPIPSASDWKLLTVASSSNSQPVTNGASYVFENLALSAGTYYFAFIVGNSIGRSELSAISASFVWAPVSTVGPTGPTGTTGLNTATVYLYNKNTTTTPPALFSGTFTYTFSTAVLSGGTFNGWTQSIPGLSSGEYLFVSTATASSTTNTDTILSTEFATPQIVGSSGTDGAKTAIVSLYQKNTSGVTPPTDPSGTFTYTFATAALSGGTLNGWSQSAPTLSNGEYLWEKQATAYAATATDTIAAAEFSSAVVVGIGGINGVTGPTGSTGALGPTGVSGNQVATVFLYQWATATPGNPSGQSTYTWNPPGNASYTGGNGWSVSIPANPGTPLIQLWVASKSITDTATATTTTVSWTSGFSVYVASQNGANGLQTGTAIVYQWATTSPTISGTSIYTWSTGAVDIAPTGWSTTISDTGTAGQTLWAAKVGLSDSVAVTTSTVNWATASIVPFGYSGSTGAVSKTAYTKASFSLSQSPTSYTVSGNNLPAANSWAGALVRVGSTANIATLSGLLTIDGVTLSANDRVLVKNQTTQSQNGIYVAASGAWTRSLDADTWPELVGLKVYISSGSTQSATWWLSDATAGGTINSTALTFSSTTAQTITWSSTVPTVSAGESVWQSDGIYNPTSNQTIWQVPYLSSLKVGNLSAIATNTGSLTVSGAIGVGANGYILGGQTAYNTGTGFFLGYSGGTYKFSIGSSTVNMLWDGSSFTVNGAAIVGSTISGGQLKSFGTNYVEIGTSSSGNLMFINAPTQSIGAPLVLWSDTAASTSYPFFSISTNSRQGGSDNAAISFTSSATNAVGLIVNQIGSSGGAGIFYNIPASKQFWVAPGLYSAYSPSGGGKIYVVDGNGPFTGFHDMLIDINSNVSVGDIVVDQSLFYKADISNTLFIGAMSSSANQTRVLGVVSNVAPIVQGTPGSLWKQTAVYTDEGVVQTWAMPPGYDAETIEAEYKSLQVNALGEGQINVCGQNGNISAGDYIVTSATPGKGMKQDDDVIHNYTVAKARESVVFDTPDQVKMIACIYLGG